MHAYHAGRTRRKHLSKFSFFDVQLRTYVEERKKILHFFPNTLFSAVSEECQEWSRTYSLGKYAAGG